MVYDTMYGGYANILTKKNCNQFGCGNTKTISETAVITRWVKNHWEYFPNMHKITECHTANTRGTQLQNKLYGLGQPIFTLCIHIQTCKCQCVTLTKEVTSSDEFAKCFEALRSAFFCLVAREVSLFLGVMDAFKEEQSNKKNCGKCSWLNSKEGAKHGYALKHWCLEFPNMTETVSCSILGSKGDDSVILSTNLEAKVLLT